MYDFSSKIKDFHEKKVRLTNDQRAAMRERRDANKDRIRQGLEKNGKPKFAETISQGGYAQKTMVQPPEQNKESRYDIDMGVVFEAEDAKTAQTMRNWVRDALIAAQPANMKNEPECKSKCVRVVYADGYQCDFPVFRRTNVAYAPCEEWEYELAAGNEWVKSDPRAMNKWIDDQVTRSPNVDGSYQLRRIIRLLKYFAKAHSAHKNQLFPSGLLLTALAIEQYQSHNQRDDCSFRETLRGISNRSADSPVWANGTRISQSKHEVRIQRLIDIAESTVSELDKLDDCRVTEGDAQKAWHTVFLHSFFEADHDLATMSAQTAPPPYNPLDQAIEQQKKESRDHALWLEKGTKL